MEATIKDPIPSGFFKLVSSSGKEFLVPNEAKSYSSVISQSLDCETFVESKTRTCSFKSIDDDVMDIIVKYFNYKIKYKDTENPDDIPEFSFDPAHIVGVILASHFLDI